MRILFVCVGNICRSPMAEALLRQRVADADDLRDIHAASAGVGALEGEMATEMAIEVMRSDVGIDITPHRARRVTSDSDADLLLAMEERIRKRLAALPIRGEVALLGDYAGYAGEEVPDPYGGSYEAYAKTVRQIDRLISGLVGRLRSGGGS